MKIEITNCQFNADFSGTLPYGVRENLNRPKNVASLNYTVKRSKIHQIELTLVNFPNFFFIEKRHKNIM